MKRALSIALVCSLTSTLICKQTRDTKAPETTRPDNKTRPYVILISIDGYRHDYTKIHTPQFITKFVKEGASQAKALQPVFPSLTFPNHYSMITGLYPAKSGIIANHFYKRETGQNFHMGTKDALNPSWYKGRAVWSVLRANRIKTASYFWPGSSINDDKRRPDFFRNYKHDTPRRKRVQQIINWLRLPEDERPHFITLYFSDVDSAGHRFGPISKEVTQAVRNVDKELEFLEAELIKLPFKVNTIIVSDHGMEAVDPNHFIFLSDIISLSDDVTIHGEGGFSQLYFKSPSDVESAYRKLNANPKIKVFRREDVPSQYRFQGNKSIGDLIVETDPPNYLVIHKDKKPQIKGAHGYNPYRVPSMGGIFYARGPQIKSRKNLGSFENIHIHALILRIFNLQLDPKIDAKRDATKDLF